VSILEPLNTSVRDVCSQALKEAGVTGQGQEPSANDLIEAQARLQWMLQGWQRKRWVVYANTTYIANSTGARIYTVGPGGDFDTSAGEPATVTVSRPDKIESGFLRQITQSQPNQIDYPLKLMQALEDYNRIALKGLVSFPGSIYYNPDWPLGQLFVWPVPNPSIYAVGITVKQNLPAAFANPANLIELPFEYFQAIIANLAINLRPKYGLGTWPGDPLPAMAKNSLMTIRQAAFQIAELQIPAELSRDGIYNIFSDRTY
jgi:hypothetical protein